MKKEEIGLVLEKQRNFLATGKTLDIDYRIGILKKLRSLILRHEEELIDALGRDFHKPRFEVLGTESRFVIAELNLIIRKVRKWSRKKRVRNSLANFPAGSYVMPQPYGQVLILAPWNYPFHLAMVPAIAALAAGNCVVLKVSQKVPETGKVIARILGEFPGELIIMVNGEHSLTDYLLDYTFDYIFFTGSTEVGKRVMKKAAENLTPLTLELGGKNPCVVASDAKLGYAARRIAMGKFINAGQTCIAPDYLLIDEKIKDKFLELLTGEIRKFYGGDPYASSNYCRIVNTAKAERMEMFIKNATIVSGGITDSGKLLC